MVARGALTGLGGSWSPKSVTTVFFWMIISYARQLFSLWDFLAVTFCPCPSSMCRICEIVYKLIIFKMITKLLWYVNMKISGKMTFKMLNNTENKISFYITFLVVKSVWYFVCKPVSQISSTNCFEPLLIIASKKPNLLPSDPTWEIP